MIFYTYLILLDPLADLYIFVWSKLPLLPLFSLLVDMWVPRHLLPLSFLLLSFLLPLIPSLVPLSPWRPAAAGRAPPCPTRRSRSCSPRAPPASAGGLEVEQG